MDPLLAAIAPLIAPHLSPGTPVLVGLSGGPDSVVLLHALKRLGYPVTAAHLDHGLRPESADEAAWVAARCADWGIPCQIARGELPVGPGLEETAREARHAFLQATARERGSGAIALGHHADDQAETVLFRLARGTGPAGLVGMRAYRPTEGGVPLLRPMLGLTRDQIEATRIAWNLPSLTDPTNATLDFARNRLRHVAMPALRTVNPDAARHIAQLSRLIEEEEALREESIVRLAKFIVRSVAPHMGEMERGAFLALPAATRRRLLRWVLTHHGGPAGDQTLIETALAVAEHGGGTDLAGGWRIAVEEPWLVLSRPGSAPAPVPVGTVRHEGGDSLAPWGWHVRLTDGFTEAVPGPTCVRFDRLGLPDDLQFRSAEPDRDRFCPWGHQETHSLRHFLARCQVPRHRQETLLVLASGQDVYWVVGYRRGSQAKVERTPENGVEMQATARFRV